MGLKSRVIGALAGATLLGGGITTVVQVNEGYSEVAYQDSAGVWTICYGETSGVKRGMWLTKDACDRQLRQSIGKHADALVGLPESLPDVVVLGSIDMAYNVGVGGFRNSKVHRLLADGNYRAAGQAVLEWKYISSTKKPAKPAGWVYNTSLRKWRYDCSQLVNGRPNKVCYGVWERRQWQSKAIGNQFSSVQYAVQALSKG